LRRAELRLESYLAECRGGWVTMRDIKAACGLGWDEAGHVWRTALPRLVETGLLDRRRREGRTSWEYRPTMALVRGVAELQWRRSPGPAVLVST